MTRIVTAFLMALCLFLVIPGNGISGNYDENIRQKAYKEYADGNYKDAFNLYEKLCFDPETNPLKIDNDFTMAIECLTNLGRVAQIDDFIKKTIKIHEKNWRLLSAAAKTYATYRHYGYLIAGNFKRGDHRGGGTYVNSRKRDRVKALQLMEKAEKLAKNNASSKELGNFYLLFADIVFQAQRRNEAWRLQNLTNLEILPDYEKGYYYPMFSSAGAPVDTDGNPVFHYLPKSWESSETDGQRWRWLLNAAVKADPGLKKEVTEKFAKFLFSQFGVHTMSASIGPLAKNALSFESGIFALHTLKENETIARLATGIKRFTLPDEFNFIKLFKKIKDYKTLARIFENRQQYEKSAKFWEKAGNKNKVEQIRGNWGVFEPVMSQAAGTGATVDYRFRNGKKVRFEAYPIKVKKLLNDIKSYIKEDPDRFDWHKANPGAIGYRIVRKNETKYLEPACAKWSLNLKPRKNHFDKRITITTPLMKPGAYFIKAYMKNGNISRIIIWINDTVIVKKPLNKKALYFVADAVSGRPVTHANLEFFGYNRTRIGKIHAFRTKISNFAEYTDENGQVILSEKGSGPNSLSTDLRWLVIATTKEGRLAFMGFKNIWYYPFYNQKYNMKKAFIITDRPVYRPGDKVKFSFWVRKAKYDLEEKSVFAGVLFDLEIKNPKSEKVYKNKFMADDMGGASGEYEIPKDAGLGLYYINIPGYPGGLSFRVEEYKKPEFTVKVELPDEPVKLGDLIKAKISAKYLFGAPVTKATVKYKVIRYSYTKTWYPRGPWDWFYGPGYGWLAQDYAWYPGWKDWGCARPAPWWIPNRRSPSEIVMENQVNIGPDGAVAVNIDTTPAKELHGDTDHRYEIQAEVRDLSRRTIVGKGSIIAARKPFQVIVQADKGYYKSQDTINIRFSARSADDKPTQGRAMIKLYKISYSKNGEPKETLVEKWQNKTNKNGEGFLRIKASGSGQYRLECVVTDKKGRKEKGGYIFLVRGPDFKALDFRFNSLELIPDKSVYRPGEKVRLLINTNRVGSTILLFIRPENGVYSPPEIILPQGKTGVYEIGVSKKDMPNFFVEAVTISNGKIYSEIREIIVPPEKRVLNVKIIPSKEKYRPGEKASLKLMVTDIKGEPFSGKIALTVYDKAVEYISGGSNIPDIKAFFWKWRRRHNSHTESSLKRFSHNISKQKEITMQSLGVFGHLTADLNGASKSAEQEFMEDGINPVRAMAVPTPVMMKVKSLGGAKPRKPEIQGSIPMVEPHVRTRFADSAFWAPSASTDNQGMANFSFTMPENLTAWKIRAWAMGHGTRVGRSDAEVVTTKNFVIRLQAPRFFVEKDEVVLSANIHNYLKTGKKVKALIELEGPCLILSGKKEKYVSIKPGGQKRVNWKVKAAKEGEAIIRMKALTDEESDAMEMRFPVYVHGIDKMVPYCGVIRSDESSGGFSVNIPEKLKPETLRLEIRYSPTLAGAMVDALPYLADYPYGCTEQTLNRFLPSVITKNTLLKLGISLEDIQNKISNLNAQEIGNDKKRAHGWKRFKRNPVFDEKELDKMVKTGVEKLTSMQLSDGGWGWFSGWGEHSWPHTTAVVVHGFQVARKNGVAIVPSVLQNGLSWLKSYQKNQLEKIENGRKKEKKDSWKSHADNLDAFIYMILAESGMEDHKMTKFLYEDRNHLSVYAKAMYGIGLYERGHKEKLAMIMKNISQYINYDNENQTAWLNLGNKGYWWYWYGNETEANACYLKLLARTNPKNRAASMLVKYLLNNRKHSTYWNSTRDTAICIEAFSEYLKATGENKPDVTIRIFADGRLMKKVCILLGNLFDFDNRLVLNADFLTPGKHEIKIEKQGKSPVYFNSYLSYFTLEDYIKKAGLEIKVARKFYKLEKADKKTIVAGSRGQVIKQKTEKYKRIPLENPGMVKSGDLVEVELVMDSKNDYEYVVFEDMKAAGFEPFDLVSGYSPNGPGAYREFRDEKVVFFVRSLKRGRHSISYRLRAEIPGEFSALPVKAYGMYAPELRANSNEKKLKIFEK